MQIEEQNQAVEALEVSSRTDSTPVKNAQAAADIDVGAVIVGLLKAKSERTRLETLAFLRDTLYGRPAQNLSLSGGVNVNMAVWRPLGTCQTRKYSYSTQSQRRLAALRRMARKIK